MGGEQLAEHARHALGCDFHASTPDGEFTLEPVYCLGLCAQSPAIMIDGQPKARVTRDKLDRLLAQARRRRPGGRPMNAPIRIYVPRDGAGGGCRRGRAGDRGRRRTARPAVQLVRNGSRGLLWLEPMVEIATPAGRVAYGPVQPEDVAGLFEAGWLQGDAHPLRLGPTEDIPYLKHRNA